MFCFRIYHFFPSLVFHTYISETTNTFVSAFYIVWYSLCIFFVVNCFRLLNLSYTYESIQKKKKSFISSKHFDIYEFVSNVRKYKQSRIWVSTSTPLYMDKLIVWKQFKIYVFSWEIFFFCRFWNNNVKFQVSLLVFFWWDMCKELQGTSTMFH